MADYEKAAADLKARLDAADKRTRDLNDFFEALRAAVTKEVTKANAELAKLTLPPIMVQQEGLGEPTMRLACKHASTKITQDREVPSIIATLHGEEGDKPITFVVLPDETPITAQRVSLAPATEPKLSPVQMAEIIVEEFIHVCP